MKSRKNCECVLTWLMRPAKQDKVSDKCSIASHCKGVRKSSISSDDWFVIVVFVEDIVVARCFKEECESTGMRQLQGEKMLS